MIKRIFFWITINLCYIFVIGLLIMGLNHFFGININPNGSQTDLIFYCLIYGFAASLLSLFTSKWMTKRLMKMVIIEETETDLKLKKLYNKVKEIAEKADVKMPEVGIYESDDMNAFATGASKNSSLMGFSTGILDKMTDEELEGVIGHEMAHIKNGDMVTMTLIQGLVNAFVIYLTHVIARIVKEKNEGLGILTELALTMFLNVLLGYLAAPIVLYYSRVREYAADEGSAELVGKDKMISALERLRKNENESDLPSEIVAFGISSKNKTDWFSTHPTIRKRIDNLNKVFSLN